MFPGQAQLIQMVVWMLQRRLLIQLHTYVCLLVPPSEDEPSLRDEDPPLAARVGGRSLSTPSALSFGSPSTSSEVCFSQSFTRVVDQLWISLRSVCSQQWWHDPHQSQHGQFQRRAAAWWRLSTQQEDNRDASCQPVRAREAGYSKYPCCTKSRRPEDVCQVRACWSCMENTHKQTKAKKLRCELTGHLCHSTTTHHMIRQASNWFLTLWHTWQFINN